MDAYIPNRYKNHTIIHCFTVLSFIVNWVDNKNEKTERVRQDI